MPHRQLKIGEKAPGIINVVIEISRNSHNKYEFDEKTGVFKLDRVLYSPMHYPLDYGFVPETRSEDGDHLDAMVMGSDPVAIGCVVGARPIGIFKMIDNGEPDAKILCVQEKNPRFDNIKNLDDLEKYNSHLLKEIEHFFEVYKKLEGKEVRVLGWESKEAALEEIKKSLSRGSKT